MEAADITWVAGEGMDIRTRATVLLPTIGPLATVTRLRAEHPDVAPHLISTACSIAATTIAHATKLGPRWNELVLTDTLAQQATDVRVAAYRASTARDRGVSRIIDASAGAGIDSLAFVDAGLEVTAIERDGVAFACLEANLLGGQALHADALELVPVLLSESPAAVFVDPARRDTTGPRRKDGTRANAERDPERWSPPWSWVRNLAARTPVVAKVAPGIPRSLLEEASTEWMGNGNELAEACVWFGPLRGDFTRRATVLGAGDEIDAIDDTADAESVVTPVNTWLIEPHEAVIRAGLVDALAARHGLARVSSTSRWLTGPLPVRTTLARSWHLEDLVPVSDLRAATAEYATVAYKTSDIDRSAESVAAGVRHRATKRACGTVFVVMMRDLECAALVQPAQM